MLAGGRGRGIKTVIIPKENEKDLAEIPDNVKRGMVIITAATADEVLKHALVSPLVPIDWPEKETIKAISGATGGENIEEVITH